MLGAILRRTPHVLTDNGVFYIPYMSTQNFWRFSVVDYFIDCHKKNCKIAFRCHCVKFYYFSRESCMLMEDCLVPAYKI